MTRTATAAPADALPESETSSEAVPESQTSCPGCGEPLRGRVLLRGRDRLLGAPGEFAVLACETCGLACTEPRLRPEQFAAYYPQTYYEDAAGGFGGPVERLRLEAVVRYGPYRPLARRTPGRLLDVGCGSGELALTFAGRGWRVAGVEPSPGAAARAAECGLEMHCGTLDDAPWSGPTFDAIVFNHSLEHVPDPLASLTQAAALLRDGGIVAVGVPNFGCRQRRLFGERWFQLDLPRHLQHFDARTLAGLMERAGLGPVAQTTASMRPSLLLSLQYAAFGCVRWNGRGLRLAAWAAALPLILLDRVVAGDCLHVFAQLQEPACSS
jgi:2-polyprenyl-3-methyl-5-hydroxy-6-metoxy-1,4-benzoquinol methylase